MGTTSASNTAYRKENSKDLFRTTGNETDLLQRTRKNREKKSLLVALVSWTISLIYNK